MKPSLRLLSMVEAHSVTGPIKPLLMFSALARNGLTSLSALDHCVLTTRRPQAARNGRDLLKGSVEDAGIAFVAIPERLPADPRVLSHVLKQVREYAPDIVETHDTKSHFILFVLRLLHRDVRRIPWVAFHHGYTRTSWRVRLYQLLDYLTLRYATRVNTLCRPFADDLVARGVSRPRITILTNTVPQERSVDPAAAAALRAEMGVRPSDCLLLSVGRLSIEKGHYDLIDAFREVARQTPVDIRLLIAGDGPEHSRLEEVVREFAGRVVLAGHVEDPWPLYAAADIFVLPSHSEGSPLVIFEAMSAGLPIVATSVGGVPEVLTDHISGLLTPPHDSAALAARLLEVVTDTKLRSELAESARRELDTHTPERYASLLSQVYLDAIEAHKDHEPSDQPKYQGRGNS